MELLYMIRALFMPVVPNDEVDMNSPFADVKLPSPVPGGTVIVGEERP